MAHLVNVQALSYRVWKGHLGIVDKSNVFDAPGCNQRISFYEIKKMKEKDEMCKNEDKMRA